MADMDSTTSRRITVAEMAPHIHSFLPDENKVNKLKDWLLDWIKTSLECGKIKPYDFLPSKGDLACHIGVSQGTIQNVYRLIEDLGYAESKQRIGTYIRDYTQKKHAVKLTSKRELAVEDVKKYLFENGYKKGDKILSTRKLAKEIGISDTTVRAAVNCLAACGVLEKSKNSFFVKSMGFDIKKIQSETLVEKVADGIRNYVKKELNSEDKLPSNMILAKKFKISVKTVHDAIKLLSKEGLLYTRRGKYGTIVLGESTEPYNYEKVENKIMLYICENAKVGDKLPTIKEFSEMYKTSEKTIKKALDNLAEDGYLMFSRGRYGGTFVMDIPQAKGEAYKWLAINSDYVQN